MLKVNKFQEDNLKEDYVDVHYKDMNKKIQNLFDYLSATQSIIGKNEDTQVIINPLDIYYCEVVDKKNFAYLKTQVYQLDISLQNMEEYFSHCGFVRVSKSMAVNVYKIDYLKADINMRVHIMMENGERIIMNRSYKKNFYKYLKELEGGCLS